MAKARAKGKSRGASIDRCKTLCPGFGTRAALTDRGFTGQRADGFGLMDYNARYYSPMLGRFVSPDSMVPDPSKSADWDRYAYVGNSPISRNDPTGHAQRCPDDTCGAGGSTMEQLRMAREQANNQPPISKTTVLEKAKKGMSFRGCDYSYGPGISLSLEIDKFQDSSNNDIYTGVSLSVGGAISANPDGAAVYTTATNTDYVFGR